MKPLYVISVIISCTFAAVSFTVSAVKAGNCSATSGNVPTTAGQADDPQDYVGAVEACRSYYVNPGELIKCPTSDCHSGSDYSDDYEFCVCECRDILPLVGWGKTAAFNKDSIKNSLTLRFDLEREIYRTTQYQYCFPHINPDAPISFLQTSTVQRALREVHPAVQSAKQKIAEKSAARRQERAKKRTSRQANMAENRANRQSEWQENKAGRQESRSTAKATREQERDARKSQRALNAAERQNAAKAAVQNVKGKIATAVEQQ